MFILCKKMFAMKITSKLIYFSFVVLYRFVKLYRYNSCNNVIYHNPLFQVESNNCFLQEEARIPRLNAIVVEISRET